MFDEQVSVTGAAGGVWAAHVGDEWRDLDRQLRRVAKRRASLDATEARLLIAARAAQVHRHLGYGSFDEYLERALGYAPTTARDRMRVATALESLPEIHAALAQGAINFSAVREITRVATPGTERAWLEAIDGLTAREVEDCVRGHAPGDDPDDRPDPQLEPRALRLELLPEAYALFLEARRELEAEVGHPMTDSEFMAMACQGVLAGAAHRAHGEPREDATDRSGRERDGTDDDTNAGAPGAELPAPNAPPHQIALTVCVQCRRGWQDANGRPIEVSPAVVEKAQCDAVELGRVDGGGPAPVQRSIPAAVRRMVLARDHHRCQMPGCRSSRFVDLHHLVWRSQGGDHRPLNLLTTCSLHHLQAHLGRIVIEGDPGALRVTHADGRPYGAQPATAAQPHPVARAAAPPGTGVVGPTAAAAEARAALVALGFKPPEARAAVADAVAHVGAAPLEALLRAALRACPRPKGAAG